MDAQTLKAIAEMVRLAAQAQGAELADIDVTLCRSVDPSELSDFRSEIIPVEEDFFYAQHGF